MDFFIPMNNSKVFARSEVLHGWLEIIRPPNLFTIPGDIFAGASFTLIAEDKKYKVFLAIIISLLLYIAGLIFNDYCDRKTDSVERPLRPIPSGRVNPGVALFVSGALMGVALLVSIVGIEGRPSFPEIVSFPDYRVSMFQIIVILIVLILLYNGPARRIPWLGLILMGLCRGFNILLGAAASNGFLNSMVLYGAGIEAFYIVSVSSAAYGETGSPPVKVSCWLIYSSPLMLSALMVFTKVSLPGAIFLLLTIGWVFYVLRDVKGYSEHMPVKIGDLIRGLIPIQLTLMMIGLNLHGQHRNYSYVPLFLLCTSFPVSQIVGRRFYGS